MRRSFSFELKKFASNANCSSVLGVFLNSSVD